MAPARSTEPPPGTLDLVLSTLALAALALAQPVLDLLGQSPEFFVARASPALDVVLVPLVLGVGVPLLLAGVVALVHAVNQRAGRVLHRVLLVLFGGLIVVTLLEHTPAGGLSGWVLLGLGGAAGVALSWGYYRSRSLRSVFRFLAVAPVVVTAVFLLVAPTSRAGLGVGLTAGDGACCRWGNRPRW